MIENPSKSTFQFRRLERAWKWLSLVSLVLGLAYVGCGNDRVMEIPQDLQQRYDRLISEYRNLKPRYQLVRWTIENNERELDSMKKRSIPNTSEHLSYIGEWLKLRHFYLRWTELYMNEDYEAKLHRLSSENDMSELMLAESAVYTMVPSNLKYAGEAYRHSVDRDRFHMAFEFPNGDDRKTVKNWYGFPTTIKRFYLFNENTSCVLTTKDGGRIRIYAPESQVWIYQNKSVPAETSYLFMKLNRRILMEQNPTRYLAGDYFKDTFSLVYIGHDSSLCPSEFLCKAFSGSTRDQEIEEIRDRIATVLFRNH